MPRPFPPIVTPSAARTALWLSVVSLLLSGCAGHSLVSNDELEADRQKRQTLELRQDELLARQEQLLVQIISLTSAQGELDRLLAAEEAKRESLEQQLAQADEQRDALERRGKEIESYLREQESAVERVKLLTLQLEQWREQDLARQSAMAEATHEDDAGIYLQLLEKNAQLDRLNDQLGEAILEVVRTKAKLRSMESRAEAASDLAEAEIAIQAMMSQGSGWETDPGVIKARELSELSAGEFERGNYGGALYLTGQAKNVIKGVEARSVDQGTHSMVEGERAFGLPLPLRLLSNSDVRRNPSNRSAVAAALPAGAELIGYSYKGRWVRVRTSDGVGGWVYYKNLGSLD